MSVPEHLWRFPTKEAVDSLAKRFSLQNEPWMQDWEWQVADPSRIDEFLAVYESDELDDDEKFTLMETIIQSFEDSESSLKDMPSWQRTLKLIERNLDVHIYSVWYWGCGEEGVEDHWRVHEYLAKILGRHRSKYESASSCRRRITNHSRRTP